MHLNSEHLEQIGMTACRFKAFGVDPQFSGYLLFEEIKNHMA